MKKQSDKVREELVRLWDASMEMVDDQRQQDEIMLKITAALERLCKRVDKLEGGAITGSCGYCGDVAMPIASEVSRLGRRKTL